MANNDSKNDNGIFEYKPSQIAAIVFAALFGVSALYHLWMMIRKKTWFYISFNVGAFSASSSCYFCFTTDCYQ